MTKLDSALDLAAQGHHIFPLVQNSKLPLIDGWQRKATRDPEQIRRWWTCPVMGIEQDFNIGISTSRFGDDQALIVIDVDNKGDKHGDDELLKLELSGLDFPATFEQVTPTGGRHLVYLVDKPLRQGANVLAAGLDIRSRGGFIVGVGSTLDGREYVRAGVCSELSRAPSWLIDRCADTRPDRPERVHAPASPVNQDRAALRAIEYLAENAPLAVEGQGGDQTTFQVAARLKDFGVDEAVAVTLMSHWNERCSPPWLADELAVKVANAYRYGKETPGAAAPEVQFAPITNSEEISSKLVGGEHSFDKMNRDHAYVLIGGDYAVLWETRDAQGAPLLKYLSPTAFKTKFPGKYVSSGKKQVSLPIAWLDWPGRRSYDATCFEPGKEVPERFYNLWRGFTVEPLQQGELVKPEWQQSLDDFLSHALENVCGGDKALFHWLIGFFAHLVQKPWEKPLVALVFKGSKGTGKNALVTRVGCLLKNNFAVVSNARYLTSQFNSHMENRLFLVFDEAFWSGDKKAEGQLKDAVTGDDFWIERKGYEPYKVPNRTRIAIIGNEDWLCPASHDERRYAVFDVGEGRKQDRAFFKTMRLRMEAGGYRLLLRYLLDYDLTNVDVDAAPQTSGLLEQKHASLDPLYQWWLECLSEGQIVGSDFGSEWPQEIETTRFRAAFRRYSKDRNIRSRFPDSRAIGKLLKHCAPTMVKHRARKDNEMPYLYRLPALEDARGSWEKFIGHQVVWE